MAFNRTDIPQKVDWDCAPKEGPKTLTLQLDFVSAPEYAFNFQELTAQSQLTQTLSVYVDNLDNPSPFYIDINGSRQRLHVPAQSQAYLPLVSPHLANIVFSTVGAVRVTVQVLNFRVHPIVWPNGSGGSSVTCIDIGACVATVLTDNADVTWNYNAGLNQITANVNFPPSGVVSVNGQTGVVTLDTDDIPEGAANLYNREPAGGTTGQVLIKNSNANFDASWQTPAAQFITSVLDTTTIDLTASVGVLSADVVAASIGTTQLTNLGVTTAKIAAGAVTYAKIQNETAATLLGNPTGGAAAPSEITLDPTLAFVASALQRAALTGDVTAAGGSNATTIANNAVTTVKIANSAVTYAKIQNEAAASFLGNPTGAPAAPSEVTLNATLSFTGTTLQRAALTGDVTAAAGSNATTIANNAVTTVKIADANVTLAKIQNATANSKLLGSGAAGSGAPYAELSLGTNLSMTGTTLNVSGRPIVPATTFFIRTDGNDANTGLANTAGAAWLTLQHAINYLKTQDLNGQAITVNVAAGTYTGGASIIGPWAGAGSVSFVGDTTTPTNVVISVTGGNCFTLNQFATLTIGGFQLQTTTSGNAIECDNFSSLAITGAMNFGACAGGHLTATSSSAILCSANYTISGGAGLAHVYLDTCAQIRFGVNAVTLTGTPALTIFVRASGLSNAFIVTGVTTFSGAATGQRYNGALNSVINTGGGGANYFPGNAAGAVATGAQYV